jgi:hypothetical protein
MVVLFSDEKKADVRGWSASQQWLWWCRCNITWANKIVAGTIETVSSVMLMMDVGPLVRCVVAKRQQHEWCVVGWCNMPRCGAKVSWNLFPRRFQLQVWCFVSHEQSRWWVSVVKSVIDHEHASRWCCFRMRKRLTYVGGQPANNGCDDVVAIWHEHTKSSLARLKPCHRWCCRWMKDNWWGVWLPNVISNMSDVAVSEFVYLLWYSVCFCDTRCFFCEVLFQLKFVVPLFFVLSIHDQCGT